MLVGSGELMGEAVPCYQVPNKEGSRNPGEKTFRRGLWGFSVVLLPHLMLGASLCPAAAHSDGASSERPVWVFMRDRPGDVLQITEALYRVEQTLDPSRRRRLERARPGEPLVNVHDLPIPNERISQLKAVGFEIHRRSRWLNAVSGSGGDIHAIGALPFVDTVRPVGRWVRASVDAGPVRPSGLRVSGTEDFEVPLLLLNVPVVHAAGFEGAGARVAIFDTGFDLGHPSLSHVPVIGMRDFINDDGNTGFEESPLERCEPPDLACERAKQVFHGTAALSLIVGIDPETGNAIGASPAASVLLAKTENNFSETTVEEDNWVSAMEWADSLGADVISASLGYLTFDAGIGDYDRDVDLDGRTTITSRAAIQAARRGIVVCTAMGNEGPGLRTLVTPADADSILAVGAVFSTGEIAGFSSRGPTSDGRIKPDIVAPGVSVLAANYAYTDGSEYLSFTGTSAATPLIAGGVALVRQARPSLSGQEIRNVIFRTGSRYEELGGDWVTDNALGPGRPDFCQAAAIFDCVGEVSERKSLFSFPEPSFSSDLVQFSVDLVREGAVTVRIYDSGGAPVRTLRSDFVLAGVGRTPSGLKWDGRNRHGQRVASGVFLVVAETPDGTVRSRLSRLR